MKRLTFILAALLMTGSVAFAQQSKSDETLEFRPNWSLKLQGGASYTIGETEFGKLISPHAQVTANYNFHHAMSVRAGLSGWQGKGTVITADEVYKFNYLQVNADYVLHLANLFGGFKHNRVVDPYAFAGIGLGFGLNNEEAAKLEPNHKDVLSKYWDKTTFLAGRAGLGVDFWVAKNFALGLEADANCYGEKFNSKPNYKGSLTDWQYGLMAGLKFRFGGNTQPSKAYAAKVAEQEALALAKKAEEERLAAEKAAREKAAREKAEAERLAAEKAAAEKAAAEKAAAEKAALAAENSINVFFTINSSYINKVEGEKIQNFAEWVKAHPDFTISIVGHADKKTGNAPVNMVVSERRTKAVYDRLIKLGVPAERIISTSVGDTNNTFAENKKNRVVICTLQ